MPKLKTWRDAKKLPLALTQKISDKIFVAKQTLLIDAL